MKHAFKKIMALVLAIVMILGVLPAASAAKVGSFVDVDDTDWFAPYVEHVVFYDLMNGTSKTTFEPNAYTTRAMAATVLYRFAGEPPVAKASSFTDVKPDYYSNAVAWAEAEGIINGMTKTTFEPDTYISREMLTTIFWRYSGSPVIAEDCLKDFPDAAKVSAYAKAAMNWAVKRGLLGGSKEADGKTYLFPQNYATRAEVAKLFTKLPDALKPCTEHKWDTGVVTKAPTCTEAGEKKQTCSECGATQTAAVPAAGHSYVDGVCSVCQDKLAASDEIVIYYTNDVHTYVDGTLSYDSIADLKKQTAKVAAGTLLLDAGDHIQGTAYGSMDKGESIIKMMNAAGYDAATLGNHEFDYGMERTLAIIEEANFPYLSANFYHEKDGVAGDSVLDAYKIFTVGGKKIAVIGITTPESFTKSTPKYFQDEAGNYIYGIAGGTDGSALYSFVQNAINAAKSENPDYIIALGHLGDDVSSKPWTSEELIANTTGLNAFIDGHSHATVEHKEVKDKDGKTVVLTQTGSYFDAIGKMTIQDGKISTELLKSYSGSDKDVKAIKDAWMKSVDDKLGVVIAHADITLDNYDAKGNRLVRKQETNTGDLAADALFYQFETVQGLHVDAAIMNGGGVRNKAITGDISYKTCKNIHTFGNVACLISVTGQQILDALEWGAKDAAPDGSKECGGFLQVSGITYEIHTYITSTVQKDDKGVWTGAPTGEYRVKNVTVGGQPLDLTKTYNLAGYNYTLRDLGDGFAMFKGAANVLDYVKEDYMVIADYVQSFAKDATTNLPTIKAGDGYDTVTGAGRITLVNEKPAATGEVYGLSTTLKDGDKVVFVNKANSLAFSTADASGGTYYRAGTAVTPSNGLLTVTDADSAIVWTVEATEGGFFLKNAEGKKLSIPNKEDGSGTYSSINFAQDTHTVWKITDAATSGCVYLQNTTATGTGGECKSVEWYADKSYFSMYFVNSTNEDLFAMELYVKGATPVTPTPTESSSGEGGDEPAESLTFAKVTSALTDYAGTYVVGYDNGDGTAAIFTGANDSAVTATIADGKVTVPASYALTVAAVTDGYTVEGSAGYIGPKTRNSAAANGITFNADPVTCTIAFADGEATVQTDNLGTLYTLRYNHGTNDNGTEYSYFRFYKAVGSSVTTNAYLFKLVDGSAEPTPSETPAPSESTEPSETPAPSSSSTGGSTEETVEPSIPDASKSVAIFNIANSKVMTTENDVYNSKNRMKSADATLGADKKLTTTATNVALFNVTNNNGVLTFKTADGKYLSADGKNVKLVDAEDDNTKFVLESTNDDGTNFYIRCNTAAYNNSVQYLEYYASYGIFTLYGLDSSSDKTLFTFGLYELAENTDSSEPSDSSDSSETPEPSEPTPAPSSSSTGGSTEEPVESEIYALSSELKNGDKVVFVNKQHSMALSAANATSNTNYRAGVSVTPADGKLTVAAADSAIVWTVETTTGGFFLKNAEGKKLSVGNNPKGGTYNSMGFDQEDNAVWKIATAATSGCVYLQSTTATGTSGDTKSVEWYDTNNNFSMYFVSSSNEALFAMELYVKGATPVTPTPTESSSGEGGDEPVEPTWSVATGIAVGDKIVFTATHGGKNYEMTGIHTKDYGTCAEIGSDGLAATYTLTVVEGSTTGTFAFKTSDNEYLYWNSGNALKTNATLSNNSSWVVTFVDGKAKILHATTSGVSDEKEERIIYFNASSPRFAAYANKLNNAGYPLITIYKQS